MSLEIIDIGMRFGKTEVLQGLNYDFPETGIIGLVGPNGSGKSTLLDVLSGFVSPARGKVLFDNVHVTKRQVAQYTTRLHQSIVLPDNMLVSDYILIGAHKYSQGGILSAVSKERMIKGFHSRYPELIKLLDSTELENLEVPLSHLSWGQRRCVALVTVLASDAAVLLLDEPFAGFGLDIRETTKRLLLERGEKQLIIVAEHDLHTIVAISDQVMVLGAGQLEASYEGDAINRDLLLTHWRRRL